MLLFNIIADCPKIFGCSSSGSVSASKSDITTRCTEANATAIAMCVRDHAFKL